MQRAFVFPGQGSQQIGMGRDLAQSFEAARLVFEEVDDALGQRLSRLIWDGAEGELMLTENAQPALMAVSIAATRALEREAGRSIETLCSVVAGHSLGEYSALAAAGSLTLADAARLLRLRGQAMQAAVPVGDGAMLALLPVELELAEAIARDAAEGEVCDVANDNGGGQIVLSGSAKAIGRAEAIAKARGVKRAVPLAVSAPFHCALMAPAARRMAEALAAIAIAPPAVPLIANVTATPEADPAAIRRLLVEQVTGRVRWRETMDHLRASETALLAELGSGKVLAGLARRALPEATILSAGNPTELDAVLKALL